MEAFFVETDRLILCSIQEADKDKYITLSYENSILKSFFKDEQFIDDLWSTFMKENSFVCSIFDKETKEFIGYCSIKDMLKEVWEIAIEIKTDYHHMGYGTEALGAFLRKLSDVTDQHCFIARINYDNVVSQGLMKKIGAHPIRVHEFLLHGEELEKFREEKKNSIDQNTQRLAAEFGVEPNDVLGGILEYGIETSKENIARKKKSIRHIQQEQQRIVESEKLIKHIDEEVRGQKEE